MSGWQRARVRTRLRIGVGVSVVALAAACLSVIAAPATAATPDTAPAVPKVVAAHGLGKLATRKKKISNAAAVPAHPVGIAWPPPANGAASLPTAKSAHAQVTGTPVWAGRVAGSATGGVEVSMADHATAMAAGVPGVVFTAGALDTEGRVQVGVHYAGFADMYGGNYGLSLHLVRLPACALTTPQVAACRTQTPLSSTNDASTKSVSATVTLPAPTVPARSKAPSPDAIGTATPQVVIAATPANPVDGGPAGTYSATTLKPSGTWAEGGSSGSFTYSYPISVPPAVSSLVPQLSMDYDSGLVDGQTASTATQSSWVGDGWSLSQAYVEQSFIACSDNPEGTASPSSTSDMCYDGPTLTMSLDGVSTPLVCPSPFSYTTTTNCVLSMDDGAIVTHVVNSANGSGTKFTDYWKMTERGGTTYYFGMNQLPGFSSSASPADSPTHSVDYVPVYSAHSGDPCFSSSGFTASSCLMAYRWDTDYTTDAHSNAMAFYYSQAKNSYAQDGKTTSAVAYIRDSFLNHIDYGFTAGNAYAAAAPDQVVFTSGDRCFAGSAKCDPLSSSTAPNWPDTPDNFACSPGASCQTTAPTFWSSVRLASITTQQLSGSAYVKVDSWTLTQDFPATGDGTSPTLWLESIAHTGFDTTAGGTAQTLPAVSFQAVSLPNRVNPGNFPALDRFRISNIETETGSDIEVSYELAAPCSVSALPKPATNTQSCFPVFWQQFQPPTPDWFNKYAVHSVVQTDPTGGSSNVVTSYQYHNPAWHFDDNEVVQAKFRTYGQFRGYGDVQTFTGTGSDAQTESEVTYYQGMSDDNNTTEVDLDDSQGGSHQDLNQLAGSPLETTKDNFASGPVDNSEIDSYWVSPAAATRSRSGLPALTANAVGVTEVWQRHAITDSGTTSWRDTETDTTFDATTTDTTFGLPLYVFAHNDLAQPTQQTCTANTYTAANTTLNLVGLLAEVEEDSVACGGSNPNGASAPTATTLNALTAPASVARPAQVVSDTRTYYDDPPTVTNGVVTPSTPAWPQAAPGNNDQSVLLKASDYTNGAFTYVATDATAYDSFGRPTATYDGDGNKSTTVYTMSNGVLTKEASANPLGQNTTVTYDSLRGLPIVRTDPNGIATTTDYDGLGRAIDVWTNGRATSSAANYIYTYSVSDSAPTVVTTQQLDEAGGYSTSTTLYDALLRQRQTQRPTPPPLAGSVITDNFYDSRGWLVKTNMNYYDPTDSPGDSVITVPDDQVADQTVTAYDGLYRPVLLTSYDDSKVASTMATAYYGDRTTTVPPQGGTPTSTVTDALGRTTEIDDYTTTPTVATSTVNDITTVSITGGATQPTTYSFDPRGGQTSVRSAGETWTSTYNLLGQLTAQSDPNSGATRDTYDNAGKILTTTDANGSTVSYTYDALGRKTAEYNGPSSSSPPMYRYGYDNSNNAVSGMTDPIGQLTTETSYDSAGNAYTLQNNGFNEFGKSTGQTWTIPGSMGVLAGTYTSSETYTPIKGLPSTVSYPASPDGAELPAETLNLTYTPGFDLPSSLGSTLAGYEVATSYNALSQVAEQELGTANTNAALDDTYDPHTGALTDTKITNDAVSATTPMDDTSYAHDPSGNITSTTDNRATSGGNQSETQCYSYDTLGQLSEAWTGTDSCQADPAGNGGSTVGDAIPGSAYWTSWAFNAIGERTSQTQHSTAGGANTVTAYSYNSGQPNTLASTSTTGPSGSSATSYSYDADGNTTTRNVAGGAQSLTWNNDGTLASAATPSGSVGYVYDVNGNVLVQNDSVAKQTTLYIFGEQIVLNSGGATPTVTGTRIIALPGGGEIVRDGAGANFEYELANQQGTGVLTLSSTLQSPVWRQFTPYGVPRGTPPSSWPDTNGFLDKTTDSTTGLTIIGQREYDPATGLFLSTDPMLDFAKPGALADYTYSADDPINKADPTGAAWIDTGGCIGSVAACTSPGNGGTTTGGKGGGGNGGGKGGYAQGYTPTLNPYGGQQNFWNNVFKKSPAPHPKPRVRPTVRPYTQPDLETTMGCDGPHAFNLGTCTVEEKSVVYGLKASHITPLDMALAIASMAFGPEDDALAFGGEAAAGAGGKLLPGATEIVESAAGDLMKELIDEAEEAKGLVGDLPDAVTNIVQDDVEPLLQKPSPISSSSTSTPPPGTLQPPPPPSLPGTTSDPWLLVSLAGATVVQMISRGWDLLKAASWFSG